MTDVPELLVSGMCGTGGIFRVSGSEVERIDPTPSMGLVATPLGLYRVRFSHTEAVVDRFVAGELVASWSIEGASHPHSITYHQGRLVVGDTHHDRVVWLDPETGAVLEATARGDGDRRHISTLAVEDGRLLATIFGRFEEDRGWWGRGPDRLGELIDVETDEAILTGLAAPHSPRRWGDGWLIVNTFEGALSYYDGAGRRARDCVVAGWPVGLAVRDGFAWVGVGDSLRPPNAPAPHGHSPGRLVGVDLEAWEVAHELALPCHSIYEVVQP